MASELSGQDGDQTPRGLARTVLRGASLAAGGYVLAQGLNLVVYLVLARLLTPEDFGVYAAATILLGFMGLVSESGITAALIHRKDRVEEAMSTGAAWTLIAGLGLSLAALALSPAIGAFFDDSQTGEIAAVMSGVVLLQTLTCVPSAILQRIFSFRRRMIIEPVQVVVFGAVAIVAAAKGMGAWALVIGQYAGVLIDTILSWALVRFRPQLRLVSIPMWRELAGYGRHVFAGSMALRVGEQSDTAIVGKFLGAAPLGQFRYAFRLAMTPFQMLLSAAAYVLFPAFARISGDRGRFQAAFLRSLRWMCVLGFPGGLILIPLGLPLAVLVFGDVWREAGYAAMGMGLYTGAMALNSIASEGLKADGRPEFATRMNIVTATVTVIAMLALVPLGLTAVAVGLSLGAACGAAVGLTYAIRVIGLRRREVLGEIWPPLLAALAMVAVITPVEFLLVEANSRGTAAGLALLAAEGAVAAVIYTVALAALAPETGRELLRGVRGARRTLAGAIRGAPDEEALTEAEAPLPGSSVR
jgi:PST family polysaccharide transporter